jgi:hypothetical protein
MKTKEIGIVLATYGSSPSSSFLLNSGFLIGVNSETFNITKLCELHAHSSEFTRRLVDISYSGSAIFETLFITFSSFPFLLNSCSHEWL